MILALVLFAQVSTAPQNPCWDQLGALCRISPYFCPTAYPANLVPGTNGIPCWPERESVAGLASSGGTRQTVAVHRSQSSAPALQAERSAQPGAVTPQPPRSAAKVPADPADRLSFLRRLLSER